MNFQYLNHIVPISNMDVLDSQLKYKRQIDSLDDCVWGRIYANGKLRFTKHTIDTFNLNFSKKDDSNKGNGIDIIDSKTLKEYPQDSHHVVFLGFSDRNNKNQDLLTSCKYNADSTPKGSAENVIDAEEFISLLFKVYFNLEFNKETFFEKFPLGYADLHISSESFKTSNNIYHLTKKYSRGDKKGQPYVEKRVNLVVKGIYPMSNTIEENVTLNDKVIEQLL